MKTGLFILGLVTFMVLGSTFFRAIALKYEEFMNRGETPPDWLTRLEQIRCYCAHEPFHDCPKEKQ